MLTPPITETKPTRPLPRGSAFMAARDLDSHGFFLAPLLQPGFDVLDAGCGPGTISAGIAETVYPGRVTGLDIAPARLHTAQKLAIGREIRNIGFVAADAYQLPFEDASFDVVFAHALLEHLSDPQQSLREFHRVTRPGGFVALCSPDWEALDLEPHSMRLGRAIEAYRVLQESQGGNTRAGALLNRWQTAAGFTPLACSEWTEDDEDAERIAEYLARQLSAAGQFHHATTLREWAAQPGATFRQNWKYAIGVRADAGKLHRSVVE